MKLFICKDNAAKKYYYFDGLKSDEVTKDRASSICDSINLYFWIMRTAAITQGNEQASEGAELK